MRRDQSGAARRWALVVVGVVLVAAVGVLLWMTLRDNARPVAIDDARDRLGSTTGSTDDGVEDPGSSVGSVRPTPGVYRFTGEGTEGLSTPPLSQSQGPEMPATVTLDGEDCWVFRLDYSTNHWQQWRYCWDGDDLVEAGGDSWQRWMVGPTAFTNTGVFECAAGTVVIPAQRRAGQTWSGTCTGRNDGTDGEMTSSGPYRFVGETTLPVAGADVDALHFVRERTMSGAQTGTERSEVWFDATTGLPLRNERTLEAQTETVIGASTYTEEGWFQLAEPGPV